MKEDFLNPIQALALKELGFDEPCIAFYKDTYELKAIDQHWGSSISGISKSLGYHVDDIVLAPLYQQAFKWFRDEYKLWFRPDYYDEIRDLDFTGSIHKLGKFSALYNLEHYTTAEECESACIDKLIEMAKNEKHTHMDML